MFTKARIFALTASTAGILALGAPLASAASADVAPNTTANYGYGNGNGNGNNGSGTNGSADYGAYSGVIGSFPGGYPTSCGNSANGSNPGGGSLGNNSGGGGGGGNTTSGCDQGGLIQDADLSHFLG